jgi:N4-gp56 family major capsid protein
MKILTVYIEETLKSADLPADLIPNLVYGEILMGARKPLVFLQCVKEDFSLVTATGKKISIPKMSQFDSSDVSQDSETNITTTGYSVIEPSVTDVDVVIANEIYVAVTISKQLLEDSKDVDWVRATLQNMGSALSEFLDETVRDAIISGAGTTIDADTGGTLKIADVVDGVTELKKLNWYPQGDGPFLIVYPDQSADILKDTTFTPTERYTTSDPAKIVNGEVGKIASCRVLESSGMIPALALIVMQPNHGFGPSTYLAWKRRMDVEVEKQVQYGKTLYVASMREGVSVAQASAILLISNC